MAQPTQEMHATPRTPAHHASVDNVAQPTQEILARRALLLLFPKRLRVERGVAGERSLPFLFFPTPSFRPTCKQGTLPMFLLFPQPSFPPPLRPTHPPSSRMIQYTSRGTAARSTERVETSSTTTGASSTVVNSPMYLPTTHARTPRVQQAACLAQQDARTPCATGAAGQGGVGALGATRREDDACRRPTPRAGGRPRLLPGHALLPVAAAPTVPHGTREQRGLTQRSWPPGGPPPPQAALARTSAGRPPPFRTAETNETHPKKLATWWPASSPGSFRRITTVYAA